MGAADDGEEEAVVARSAAITYVYVHVCIYVYICIYIYIYIYNIHIYSYICIGCRVWGLWSRALRLDNTRVCV